MKFLLFYGDQHYPAGGWRDLQGAFATQKEAADAAIMAGADWWHVVDLAEMAIVERNTLKQ